MQKICAVFSLIIGGGFGWGLVKFMSETGASYLHYQYPVWYALGYVVFAAALPALISAAAIKSFSKESIVQRLRQNEA